MSTRSTILGCAFLVVLLTAGAAQSLAGSNTVFSDDIVDGTITTPDLKDGALSGSKILDNSVTGNDINEATIPGFKKVYMAKVNLDGSLQAGGDAISTTHANPGLYEVRFPGELTYACAAVASARTQYSPTAFASTGMGYNYVSVRLSRVDTGANVDRPFDVVVVCR